MPSMRKRKRRRQGRFAPVFKLLFLVAMAAALVLGATVFFQVEHIVVTGNSRYTQQAVINATGIDLGDNLFGVSKTHVSQNIRRRLPYVQAVQVLRRLPNTVSITVTESAAAAQLEGEGGWLINASGKLLEQANGEQVLTVTGLTPLAPAAGTHLVTDEAAAFKRESLLGLLQALEERELLEQAMSIDLTRDAWIEMEFTQRFRVKLPYGADYLHKLRALEAAISSREEYETGIMDLTQPDYDVVFQPD